MKFKSIFWFACVCMLALSACVGGASEEAETPAGGGSVDENGNVTLEFWYSLSGTSGETIEAMVEQFNEAHENINVVATYQGNYSAMMAKVYSALAGDTMPNVAQLGGAPLLGSSGAILPITDFTESDDSMDLGSFLPAFLDYNSAGGTLWSMPFNNSVPVMYYNRDLFTAAGLDPDQPPQNFEELIAAAGQMTLDPDNTGTPTQYGLNARDDTHWFLSTMFLENDAQIVSADMSEMLYNSPEAVEMLALWDQMVNEYQIMPANQHAEAQTDFLAGKLAMLFGSSASINSIKDSATFDLGVSMFPKVGDNESKIPIGGGSLVIFKNENDAIRAASWEFVKFMTSRESSIYLSTNTGYLPLYSDAMDWPEIQALMAEEPLRIAAIQTLDAAVAIPVFNALGNSDLALRKAVEEVELGVATPQEALDDAVASVNRAIQEQYAVTETP